MSNGLLANSNSLHELERAGLNGIQFSLDGLRDSHEHMRGLSGLYDRVLDAIAATGYGLTLGIHSRNESHAEELASRINVGNVYINRNQIGAVVGSQPFGGEGLSGTGPKAGGPLYLARFFAPEPVTPGTEWAKHADSRLLKRFGFTRFAEYAYLPIKTAQAFNAALDYIEDRFTISPKTGGFLTLLPQISTLSFS